MKLLKTSKIRGGGNLAAFLLSGAKSGARIGRDALRRVRIGRDALVAATVCVAAALPSWATVNRNWVGGGDADLDGRYLISAANNWDSGRIARCTTFRGRTSDF